MIPIISIVGKTNSGKTTLVERIISELKKRGYKVGAIKHDVHQFEIDHEGKDTYRMTQAGANTVVIASDKKLGMIKDISEAENSSSISHYEFHKKLNKEPTCTVETLNFSLDKIVEWLFPDVDVVITEGYKRQDKPKLEVTRTGELLCSRDDKLIAIVDNSEINIDFHLLDDLKGIPIFKLNEISKIIEFLKNKHLI